MSERTLQRRLEQEATSFVHLLDDTRRELAEQYLGRLHLSLAQTAYLLGFADQSIFFAPAGRWFDLSPGQYRSQLLGQAPDQSRHALGPMRRRQAQARRCGARRSSGPHFGCVGLAIGSPARSDGRSEVRSSPAM
jgi:AraC-like DNA-binding protein